MSYSYTEKRRIRKNFGRLPKVMELPKLIQDPIGLLFTIPSTAC